MTDKNAHIIVVSNEKGGTGKSTISMHLAIKLLQEGFSVLAVDMDGRQGTLSRYIHNRNQFAQANDFRICTPEILTIAPVDDYAQISNHIKDSQNAINQLKTKFDAIIIDTAGNKNYLFDVAHQFANTLITPMSDSLIDLNVLSQIDSQNNNQVGHYAQYVWEVKKTLAQQNKTMLNWIVVGNKVSAFNSRNKNQVFEKLNSISKLCGFRVAKSIKDRVIYKELFMQGLTVLDLNSKELKHKLTLSHIAAKQEIRDLAEFICP